MLCVKHVKHAERRNAYVLGVEWDTEVTVRFIPQFRHQGSVHHSHHRHTHTVRCARTRCGPHSFYNL